MLKLLFKRYSLLVAIASIALGWLMVNFGREDAWYRDPELVGWFIGFVVIANCVGAYFVHVANDLLTQRNDAPIGNIPHWMGGTLTGIIERSFFSITVAFNLGGAIIAMIAWTTVKNAAVWTHLVGGPALGESSPNLTRSYSAMLLGFFSMFIALLGGVVWRVYPEIQYSRAESVNVKFEYSILHYNIESGGNDPATIANELIELGRYDIVGLSEVADPEPYEIAINKEWSSGYHFIRGYTGVNNGREPDRLMLCINSSKFDLVESADMQETGGVKLNDGRHRAPLYARLRDKENGKELIVVLNHLARGDAEFRALQAAGLREWARNKSTPIVAIGDYNFDYDFHTKKGNAGFDEFLKDGVWKWIKPEPMIDTNWSDDGKGNDRYPNSMLDFNFVAGAAKDWEAECRVIVREGDFPDDDTTSDHRPVELILTR